MLCLPKWRGTGMIDQHNGMSTNRFSRIAAILVVVVGVLSIIAWVFYLP